ncbi:MAG: lipopolysaccharide transport periplasmic protein LptA [Gammaproteobacteria bacterium]|nr:lipopolysaccharide transport periplasmic protein LptA [Gammaproteobacteria bacterium]
MEKLNRIKKASFLFACCLLGSVPAVLALSTDKDQPIEVEADYAELDDEKGITIYKGNVIVTQGSMRIDGDEMVVTYDENDDLDTLIVTGRPAHYQQMPDGGTIPDEAEALKMEYHSPKNLIVLINEALVKQEGLRFSGNRIEYDTERSKVYARGSQTVSEQTGDAQSENRNDRVRLTIKPKKKKQ